MDKTFYLNSVFTKSDIVKGKKRFRIAGYANTVNKDRQQDIIPASAWVKGVESYRKNPILLFQHKQEMPIGRVEKITVDKNGLFVEATISDAAEKAYNVQTLINDGVLKSFSVGFRPKDAKLERSTGNHIITDLELLEISVVSIPANEHSLFSVRKSLNDEEYAAFEKEVVSGSVGKDYKAGITDVVSDHYHALETDADGNGKTTYSSHGSKHVHTVKNGEIESAEDHTHTVLTWKSFEEEEKQIVLLEEKHEEETEEEMQVEVKTDEVATQPHEAAAAKETSETEEQEAKHEEAEEIEEETPSDPYEPIPFVNLLNAETSQIKELDHVKFDGKRWVVSKIATSEAPSFEFKSVDVAGNITGDTIAVEAERISIINTWDLGSKFDLSLNIAEKSDVDKESILAAFKEFVNGNEHEVFSVRKTLTTEIEQDRHNKVFNLITTPSQEWNDTNYIVANSIVNNIKALMNETNIDDSDRTRALQILGHKAAVSKENNEMTTQSVGDPIAIGSSETVEKASVQVSAPRVEELVSKTGEAILKDAEVQEKAVETGKTPVQSEEVSALKAELSKMADELRAVTRSKMVYQENQRSSSQFTQKDIANAYLLAKALRKDVYDTHLGMRMKAVTSVDAFLSNFSTDLYEEMQQQLVIAPMFRRIQVDAQNFRVPVADEDTDGDVAQFASGTYNTGIADTTRVPTTNQHTIKAVTFTPHKFMATTHIAKDEQEDTILPLLDFLRQATTRRMARAIDKALLRGDGSLSGFTASPTNAISVGAGYAAVFKGVVTLATDASLTEATGASTAATPTDIANARALMGRYGLQLGDHLVYLTTIEGYNALVTTSDFQTVDKFGPNATYLTGSLGAVYGIPVVITEFLDNKGASNNRIGLLMYKPGFLVAERRAMEVESEYEPRQQVTALYLSTRFDMKALTTETAAALSSRYSYAVALTSN